MARSILPRVNPPNYKWCRAQIFFITWLAYVGFYLVRKAFSVAKIELKKEEVWGISKATMGNIDLAYLVAYAIGQFIWGITADRVGTRRVVLTGMLVSIVMAFVAGASTITVLLGVVLFIQGLAQSTGWAPLTKNIGNFFGRRERGRVMGFWCSNYAVGGLIASTYAGWAAQHFGDWRYAFWVPAATLLGIWILFIILQRDKPEDFSVSFPGSVDDFSRPQANPGSPSEAAATDAPVISPYRNPVVIHLAAVYFFLKPTRYMILFWSPLYLNEKLNTGIAESGFLSGMFELAGPLGVICGGFLSDLVFRSRRMPVCVIFFLLLAVLLFLFNGLPATRVAMGMGLLGIGFLLFAPDSLISATAAIDFGTQKGAGTAAGLINGVGSIGAAVGGYLPALLTSDDNVTDWDMVFRILACFVLAAGLLLIPLWNAVPKEDPGPKTVDDSNGLFKYGQNDVGDPGSKTIDDSISPNSE
ncbi:MAG: MFS transporter [Pirellulaceae bacterium]